MNTGYIVTCFPSNWINQEFSYLNAMLNWLDLDFGFLLTLFPIATMFDSMDHVNRLNNLDCDHPDCMYYHNFYDLNIQFECKILDFHCHRMYLLLPYVHRMQHFRIPEYIAETNKNNCEKKRKRKTNQIIQSTNGETQQQQMTKINVLIYGKKIRFRIGGTWNHARAIIHIPETKYQENGSRFDNFRFIEKKKVKFEANEK